MFFTNIIYRIYETVKCGNLTSVIISDGVTTIDDMDLSSDINPDHIYNDSTPGIYKYTDELYNEMNLKEITIPNKDVSIDPCAFWDVTKVTIGDTEVTWEFGKDGWNWTDSYH